MKKSEVKVGKFYRANVSGVRTTIQITGESPYGGWDGVNTSTGKKIRVRSVQRLLWSTVDPAAPSTRHLDFPVD